MAIKGLEAARRNTKKVFEDIRTKKAARTVVEILIAGRSYTLMLTPVDTSNLINSQFIDHEVGTNSVKGVFGFTAEYAAAVHEKPGTLKGQPRSRTGAGNYWDPNAEPKFVEKGFDNKASFDAIVERNMKL